MAPAAKKPAKPPVKTKAKPMAKPKAPPKPAPARAPVAKPAPRPAAAPAKAVAKAVAKPVAKPIIDKPAAKPAAKAQARAPFPKKNLPPSEAEFSARLPLALGKRFEMVRAFIKKQPGIREDLYYYGPKTGWAYRYLRGTQSICSIVIHDERLMGIVALDAAAQTAIVWEGLSPVAQKARKLAHGSPALIWVDVPFEGTGAKDFQALLKGKLRTLPPPTAAPAPSV
jgi:Protein of unknown function (DUF3788)